MRQTPLRQFRVLEIASVGAATVCGRLLADLGADVIKIEPPGGCVTRRRGPCWRESGLRPVSLSFLWDNLNKKGITLDLTTADGKDLFRRLARTADAVIESTPAGYMESLGLGYGDLRQIRPEVVWTSMTPFGRTGPKANWKADDFVAFAAGGLMYISGKTGGPPVAAPDEQAYRLGGSHGAFGTLVALWARQETGVGQLVEVSLQECLAAQENLITDFSRKGEVIPRTGSQHRRGVPGRIYPCKNGFVHLMVIHTQPGSWENFLDWVGRPKELGDPRLADPMYRRAHPELVDDFVRRFLRDYTKEELYHQAQERHIPCTPVNTPTDFVSDEHVAWRGFVAPLNVRGKDTKTLGLPFKSNEGDWIRISGAPEIGEQNLDVYGRELGLTLAEIGSLMQAGVI